MQHSKHKKSLIYGFIFFAALGILFITSLIFSETANTIDVSNQFQPPSVKFIFGTDNFGRDIFLRTLVGFFNAFFIAIISQLISYFFGILLGVTMGYYGGLVDEVFYYICNVMLTFPALLMAIFFATILGSGNLVLIFILSLLAIFYNAKIIRAHIKIYRNNEYITGLKIIGASSKYIIFHHLIQEAMDVILPLFPLMIGHTILYVASYSFLGFGTQILHADIGYMLRENSAFFSVAPWAIILPGLFQLIIVWLMTQYADVIKREFNNDNRMISGN